MRTRRLALATAIGILAASAAWAAINLGMPNAVKSKAKDLDGKVAQYQQSLINGTAASGHPMSSQTLTFGDCSGNLKTATTGSDGTYSLDPAGMSFPVFLKIGPTPSYYSVAFAGGTVNVHPLTDLALRTYYRSARGMWSLDSAFNGNFTPFCGPPPPASVSALTSLLMNTVSPAAARDGVNPVAFDFFGSAFSADGSGFDAVLDQTSIAANVDYSTITITDLVTGVVLSTIAAPLSDPSTPAIPSGLTAPNLTSNSVTLQWTASASTDVAGYGLYRNGVLVTNAPGTAYTDTSLTNGTSYTYEADAFNWRGYRSGRTGMLHAVTGTPNPSNYALTVTAAGGGAGSVTSSPTGINCGGGPCSANFGGGTLVTLTATPAAGSAFAGWSGSGCSGTGFCSVTMSAAQSVTATFTLQNYALTVSTTGSGSGYVLSSPTGINCGSTASACSTSYVDNTRVTLTAVAAASSTFTGWSGAGCSGTGTCSVTMSAAQAVAATFVLQNYALTVSTTGTGSGYVLSSPTGINCGSTTSACSSSYAAGTRVTLTANTISGTTFTGWSGAGCSGTGTCALTMSAAQSVTAAFTSGTGYILTVSTYGVGGGIVTSSPAGINCSAASASCSASFASGAQVVLTATATAASSLAMWNGGACSGMGTCTVTMSGAKSVSAQFSAGGLWGGTPDPNAIVISPSGSDSNACTVSSPCLTLTKAQTAVEASTSSKTVYLRAGTYNRTTSFDLGSADSGETWMTYPRDAVDSAVINGGGTLDGIIVVSNNAVSSSVTINGLKVENPVALAIIGNGATPSLTIENCDIGNNLSNTDPGWSGWGFGGWAPLMCVGGTNVHIYNNYVHDSQSQGIAVYAFNAGDTIDGSVVSGNVVLRAVQAVSDGGAIYTTMKGSGLTGGHVTITNNFVRDQGAPAVWGVHGIYLDDNSSHETVVGNVVGPPAPEVSMSTAVEYYAESNSAIIYNSGDDNSVIGNVIDLGTSAVVATTAMDSDANDDINGYPVGLSNNAFTGNVVLSNFAGGLQARQSDSMSGAAFTESSTPTFSATISNNVYWNYASGGLVFTTGPITSDSNPINENPLISGTTYLIATNSPVYGSVSIAGGWGPPGFVVPAGTPPSYSAPSQAYVLRVAVAGSGNGTVSSLPYGIYAEAGACEWFRQDGWTCAQSYSGGAQVTLTAAPNTGSTFTGWSGGGCSGTAATCTVTMSAAETVTATFATAPSYALTVSTSGPGTGIVSSSPSGINCGSTVTTCSADYTSGTQVTLTAAGTNGASFSGWGGACSGTGTCTVTMSAAQSVTASFSTGSGYSLTLSTYGTVGGQVTASPSGVNCGNGSASCSASYAANTVVTLTTSTNNNAVFAGWGGACSGFGATCVVTMSAAKSVTAAFYAPGQWGGTPDPNAIVIAPASASPAGSDAHACTLAAPCLTLTRAQWVARSSSDKTIYLRSGTYSLSAASTVTLTSSDNNETWMTYPGDPVDSAVIDGGAKADGLFTLTTVSSVTFNGLTVQNPIAMSFVSTGNNPGTVLENCNVGYNHSGNSAYGYGGWAPMMAFSGTYVKIMNNYVHDTQSQAISLYAYSAGSSIGGSVISGNVVLRAVQSISDGGSIYTTMWGTGDSGSNVTANGQVVIGSVTITNNFMRDYGSSVTWGAHGIYLDDDSSHEIVTGNVVGPPNPIVGTGPNQQNGDYGTNAVSAFIYNTGNTNTVSGNIVDLGTTAVVAIANFDSDLPHDTDIGVTNDNFIGNVVLSNFTGPNNTYNTNLSGAAYYENPDPLAYSFGIRNNVYWNYASGGSVFSNGVITNTSTGAVVPATSDSNPINENPQISGLTYTIGSGSPIYNSPVNFPAIVGGWGPPGFVIPAGTPPSTAGGTSSYSLTVSAAGSGAGTVTSSPTGIDCGNGNTSCSSSYSANASVTLTAAAAGGSTFAGWSGAGCSGTGTCAVTMSAAESVTATFNTSGGGNYTLAVSTTGTVGTSGGTVTSSPSGINCTTACSASIAANTQVTLTATPAGNSAFAGWSGGGCYGISTCTVTMSAAQTVTAEFSLLAANPNSAAAPAQSFAVGFSSLVFDEEFTSCGTVTNSASAGSGYNWYPNWWNAPVAGGVSMTTGALYAVNGKLTTTAPPSPTSTQTATGVITIVGGQYGGDLSTVPNSVTSYSQPYPAIPGSWRHAYFEARIQVPNIPGDTNGWPGFWSWGTSWFGYNNNGSSSQWLAAHTAEDDFMELWPDTFTQSGSQYYLYGITTLHDWQHGSSASTDVSNTDNVNNMLTSTGTSVHLQSVADGGWHTYGNLWVQTSSTTGYIEFYLDNQLVVHDSNITRYLTGVSGGTNGTVKTTNGVVTYAASGGGLATQEQEHMYVLIQGGDKVPINIDWVRVWQ